MRDLAIVLGVMAIGLAIVATAVFGLGDTSVLVSPPDAVTETFVRELAMERYELARQYLSTDLAEQTSAAELRASFEPLQDRTGRPNNVITATASRNADHARVLATLEGRKSTTSMYVDLVREDGLWKIATWPLDVVAR